MFLPISSLIFHSYAKQKGQFMYSEVKFADYKAGQLPQNRGSSKIKM